MDTPLKKPLRFLKSAFDQFTSRLPLRSRLVFLFVFIFGTALVTFSIFSFKILERNLARSFDDALYNYAVDVFDTVSLGAEGDLEIENPYFNREKVYPFSLGTALIQIRHSSGRIVAQIGEFGEFYFPYHQDKDRIHSGEAYTFRTLTKVDAIPEKEAESYRMLTVPLDQSKAPQLFLQIAVPMTVLETQLETQMNLFFFLVPLALAFSTLAGLFFSHRALHPIQEMIEKTKSIEAIRLSQRLPVPAVQDELRNLALTINQMLDRIEKAFQSQERFVADASHQLLTPLSIMKGEIDRLSRQENLSDKKHLQSLTDEVDSLTNIVKDLLLLARVEAGKSALTMQKFTFDEILMRVIARLEPKAKTKKIGIRFHMQDDGSHPPEAVGEVELLSILFFNLIENALKYSSEEGEILVTWKWTTTHHLVDVEDFGPGLEGPSIDLLFERFHRGGQTIVPGHGLGLSIAKKIADAHECRIWAESKNKTGLGAVFHFEMKII